MANVKISNLTAASAAAGANEFEINEAGVSKKVTGSQIATYVQSTLGTLATQNANNVNITGGSITGITDLAVANGGTGVSTLTGIVKGNGTAAFSAAVAGTDYLAPAAIGTTVLAYDSNLQSFVNTFTLPTTDGTANQVLQTNGSGTLSFANSGSTNKAWVNFNGTANSNLTGTYSQSGTVVTVTITSHGYSTGDYVYLDFTTGTAVDGGYTVTVTGVNTFTVTQASRTTSGNVTSIRNTIRGSFNVSSVTDVGTGNYSINFITPITDANYAVAGTAVSTGGNNKAVVYIEDTRSLTTTTAHINTRDSATAANIDSSIICLSVFR